MLWSRHTDDSEEFLRSDPGGTHIPGTHTHAPEIYLGLLAAWRQKAWR